MKMLLRLRYLLEEGFEVISLFGYEGDPRAGRASIHYFAPDTRGRKRRRIERFIVERSEMEACAEFLMRHIK